MTYWQKEISLLNSNNILVTGGAGYIGSHVCKALAAEGFTPVTMDNLVYGHKWAVKWGPLEIGDLTDATQVSEVVKKYRPIAVMHFAAFAYVGESVKHPDRYYFNNVYGSLNLLRVLWQEAIKNIVFSSTCATYGIPDSVPIVETHRQVPINPYGTSKLMVESMLRDFDLAYGMRSVSLRYFNAAGADPDGEIGEDHDPETHAIPLAIQAALGKRAFFEIYGTDYPTDDGTAIRDYIHVSDLASGHILALKYLLQGGERMAVNLGTGRGHSVREMVASVERMSSGRTVPVREGPRRPGDPPILIADASMARDMLGWRPKYTELDTIVGTAWRWHTGR